MATSVRKAKRAKQSFEFVDSVPEKDMIQVQTPPQDGISETIHETMLDRVEHETHPFFVNKELLLVYFRKCCFQVSTYSPYADKMQYLLNNFWKTQADFLQQVNMLISIRTISYRLTFLKFTDEKRQGCFFQRGSI
jgi:hypothetical protein